MRSMVCNKRDWLGPLVLAVITLTGGSITANADTTGLGSLPAPTLWLELDNAATNAMMWGKDLSSFITLDAATGNWGFTNDFHWDSNGKLADGTTPLYSIDIKASDNHGNVDPFINYSVAVRNNSATSVTFNRVFNAPIAPNITGANTVQASVGGVITDGTGNGASITPTPLPSIQQDSDGISELQILRLHSATTNSWTNAGVDVGQTQSYSGAGLHVYGVYSAGPVAGPLGSWDQMQINSRFTLSGGGDTASLSGYAEILPVPEPAGWMTLSVGLLVAGYMARRRNEIN